ncbi:ZIP family metal transporter [Paludifilum halophilum]|nr:ZIP family metal transporter [Paludifilum halophilum]
MTEAVLFSALSGCATLIGSLLVLCFRTPSPSMIGLSLGLSATVMLLVALFDLLPAAVSIQGSWAHVMLGMAGGLLAMVLIHHTVSMPERGEYENRSEDYRRLGLYLAVAIIAHHTPEGAAIGVGFGTDRELGLMLVLAMAIHNIPEGIGLAAPLLASGRPTLSVVVISLLSGGTLPLGTWFGVHYLTNSPDIVTVGLLFAATTMIWVVTQEVWPRAFHVHRWAAGIGVGLGLLLTILIHGIH